jgi:hypothetical protein
LRHEQLSLGGPLGPVAFGQHYRAAFFEKQAAMTHSPQSHLTFDFCSTQVSSVFEWWISVKFT